MDGAGGDTAGFGVAGTLTGLGASPRCSGVMITLSIAHFRHFSTLTRPACLSCRRRYLSKEGEAVVVKVEHEVRLRVPIHTIGGIVCFGQVSCSPWLMELCSERGVAISFLTENGRFMARVQGPVSGNVLVRREQYRRADDLNKSALVAGAIVTAKIMNCRTVLQRAVRDHPDALGAPELKSAEQRLASVLGDLHRDRPGRQGLALDLMEEFRPFIADRLALSLVNLRQVQAKGFRKSEAGGVLMDDTTRKEVLIAYQKRKQEEIVHPFLGDKTTVALLMHLQALLFSRYLRNDLDGYPPFVWK